MTEASEPLVEHPAFPKCSVHGLTLQDDECIGCKLGAKKSQIAFGTYRAQWGASKVDKREVEAQKERSKRSVATKRENRAKKEARLKRALLKAKKTRKETREAMEDMARELKEGASS